MCEWIFNGIGTTIVSYILSFVLGGGLGYYVGQRNVKQKTKQSQKAGNNANQTQSGNVVINYGTKQSNSKSRR